MNDVDKQYMSLVTDILENGVEKEDRTGTGTKSVFGRQLRFNVDLDAFPVITVKKTILRSLVHELIWLLSGNTNIEYLKENDVGIWNDWAGPDGELGPVYGKQWRDWNGEVDQIKNVIENIKTNPDSRRHIVSAWNVSDIDKMALPPCHAFFQFYSSKTVDGKRELSLQLYQRSADVGLGVPFNITSYSLLLAIVAKLTGHETGEFVHTFGDAHIYLNHVDKIEEWANTAKSYELPKLELSNSIQDIEDVSYEDINITGYKSGPWVKLPISV